MKNSLPYEEIEKLLEHAPVMLYKYVFFPEGNGSFLYVSSGCEDILGLSASSLTTDMGRFWEQIHADDLQRLQNEDNSANQSGDFFVSDVRFNHSQKGQIWIRISSKPSTEIYQGSVIWSGYMADVSDLKRLEETLRDLAKHDPLTQLWNKTELMDSIDFEVKRYKRSGRKFSILMIDIDDFKLINDNYGHPAGDKFLKKFAHVAQSELRDVDKLGRYGGEEFLVIINETDAQDAFLLAERIRTSVANNKIELNKQEVSITISLGITEISESKNESPERLIQRADEALYAAKKAGRNRSTIILDK